MAVAIEGHVEGVILAESFAMKVPKVLSSMKLGVDLRFAQYSQG
jgi:hypothetical protein